MPSDESRRIVRGTPPPDVDPTRLSGWLQWALVRLAASPLGDVKHHHTNEQDGGA